MKTSKSILIVGLAMGLFIMTSFSKPANACQYASSNLEYIKSKIQDAIMADALQMVRYHAYKALNGIEKTRENFLDCGCEGALESLENTLTHLKSATKSNDLKKSKSALHKALETATIGGNVLNAFAQETSSEYGSNVLVLNTKNAINFQDGMFLTQGSAVKKQVHQCLLGFESSLEKVVTEVDCADAHRFITNIYEESRLILLNTELSQHKKEYHQRVKTLTQEALQQLGDCN
ncbi:hypothetical protein [Allomuricauda sp.]|uniref:hypothetical protein n=1 Tax=Flagellimonas sp. TaxID=2058762 RepID=UPI001B0E42D9|nr:hypothetical protein [Allomuricauda sp.]MBO6830776.1 hypothetical protein [Allomuricauda sp.]